jgi:hypothetical protein
MSIFTNFWSWIKKAFTSLNHVAVAVTQDYNQALKSGLVDQVVTVLTAISPAAGHLAAGIEAESKILVPKIIETELGVAALGAAPTAAGEVAWANSVLQAYGSASTIKQSKLWSTLATELAILFDQGKTTNKTWADWGADIETAFQDIQQAVADNQQ